MPIVHTTGQAAGVCGLGKKTLQRCFDKGRVRGYRVPGGDPRRQPRRIPTTYLAQFANDSGMLACGLGLDLVKKVLFVGASDDVASGLRGSLKLGEGFLVAAVRSDFDIGFALDGVGFAQASLQVRQSLGGEAVPVPKRELQKQSFRRRRRPAHPFEMAQPSAFSPDVIVVDFGAARETAARTLQRLKSVARLREVPLLAYLQGDAPEDVRAIANCVVSGSPQQLASFIRNVLA